jgi:uncharacterized RDD family membrane protein YckC
MAYCPHCGSPHPDDATFCPTCGSWVAAVGNLPSTATGGRYASFWQRVGAYVIDALVIGIPTNIVSQLALSGSQPQVTQTTDHTTGQVTLHWHGDWTALLVLLALSSVASWLYMALMLSSARQATLGKMALGLVVTDEAGERISFGRATGRYLSTWIVGLTIGIGYLMVIWTRRKQALHDKIAGTLVVRKSAV